MTGKAAQGRATRPPLQAHWKVWIERDGTVLISDFRAGLLESIQSHGSVAGAAQDLGLPNRTAWKKLREMEKAAGVPLVRSVSGGAMGGRSTLTRAALRMLEAFARVAGPAAQAVDQGFQAEARHFEPPD